MASRRVTNQVLPLEFQEHHKLPTDDVRGSGLGPFRGRHKADYGAAFVGEQEHKVTICLNAG